jgi:serine/threonine protein kinase
MDTKVYILQKPSTSKTTSKKYALDCTNKLENSNYTTKDWFEITKIIEPTNNDDKNRIILGILDKHKQCVAKIGENDTLNKEFLITNELFSENVIKTYCFFKCNDDYKQVNEERSHLCNSKGNQMSVLLMEYCELGNMREFDFYKYQLAFYSCMKQSLLTLIELCYNQGFYHNDFHAGNVLIKKTKTDTIDYILGDKIHKVKTHGYKVILMDFENAFLLNKVNHTVNQKFLQDDIIRFMTDIMTNSTKITFDKKYLISIMETLDMDEILNKIDEIKVIKYKSLQEIMEERMKEY